MHRILLKKQSGSTVEVIKLAASKSESNRALIVNALSGFNNTIENLASARDTQTMLKLLADKTNQTADVLDAGTTMRFLTAYYTVTNQNKIMTGTARMCERPIGILVDALRTLGADIEYIKEEGYPPLKLNGLKTQKTNTLTIRSDVSSQFISAILMIAPILPLGLTVKLIGEIGSIPYIKMTIKQMEAYGVQVVENWEEKTLKIEPANYQKTNYQVESDWSGASYWYSVVALASDPNTKIELLGLKENSLQGDSVIVDIMAKLGVKSQFNASGVMLSKIPSEKSIEWDFKDCPDLAQTVAVVVAAKDIFAVFTGLESLKVKETDRVKALQNELLKIGAELTETVAAQRYEIKRITDFILQTTPQIHTYDDHRMAMAFAPLVMLYDVLIEEPDVVNKSYPSFWEDLQKIISIEEIK